ncbi:hypothetical protein Taro_021447 [Colocasia esculenta]|uniref:F-box domain-containing protein n=1 Tax=Colocasia esculenta TaxID=4460 RepID=A0A843V5D1_COLES|nr:hypothetical protein [Colocasia esculenta]
MEAGDGGAAATSAVGLCLLPSELLLEIVARLALPEILRLRAVSRALESLVSGDFGRILHDGGSWIFLFKKRPPRDAVLRGFNDLAGRWFRFPVAGVLAPAVPPGEDLYFLAADGDFFVFACNGRRELVAVNLRTGAAHKIPACPLGPRGTSSWRRPGLKLLAGPSGSDRFRFVFAELQQDRPVLYEYNSETGAWRSSEAVEPPGSQERAALAVLPRTDAAALLSISHHGNESTVVAAGRDGVQGPPVVYRPRFMGPGASEAAETADRLRVYGDGHMAILRSATIASEETTQQQHRVRVRRLVGVEVWGMSGDGGEWEMLSRAPEEVVGMVGRPYCVMMGCLEERGKVVRVVVMSNYKGLWDLVWLCFDSAKGEWAAVPVPDYGTKGLNMAGIAVTSSLGLLPSTVTTSTAGRSSGRSF